MDINNIIQMGAQLFKGQLDKDHDGQLGMSEVSSALMGLFSNSQGHLDIGSLLNNMKSGDLLAMAASWLGDGPNHPVSLVNCHKFLEMKKLPLSRSNWVCRLTKR